MKTKKIIARATAAILIVCAIYFHFIKPDIEAREKYGDIAIPIYMAIYAILIYGVVRLIAWLIDNV